MRTTTSNLATTLTLALALTFILGCKEEKKADQAPAETAETAAPSETEAVAPSEPEQPNEPTEAECYGKKYNPEKQVCINDIILISESGKWDTLGVLKSRDYNSYVSCQKEQPDYDTKKYGCCNMNEGGDGNYMLYDLETEFCDIDVLDESVNIFYKKCGGKEFNIRSQYCKNGKIQEYKCGGKVFSLPEFCANGELYPPCPDFPQLLLYNPKTHTCENGDIVAK